MYIYKTINLLNGKVYIGKSCKTFNINYLGSGKIIKQAVKKYGKNNFKVELIEICSSIEMLNQREIFWIDFYKENSYNIALGGTGGDIVSLLPNKSDIYKKISKTNSIKMLGHNVSDSTRKKISDSSKKWNENLSHQERVVLNQKISESMKKYYSENKHHSLGKKLSDIHKQKLSEIAKKNNLGGDVFNTLTDDEKLRRNIKLSCSLKGRKVSDETKEKIRKSLTGRPCSEEKKEKIKQTLKNRYANII